MKRQLTRRAHNNFCAWANYH